MNTQDTIQPNLSALVNGQPFTLPEDLYIPPDALRILLEAFQGPLDLLIYLIRKQNIDILNIPIAEITRQYIHYVEVMHELKLELAAEYLVMAATLAEIKSRMLIPREETTENHEEDPRAELVRRLQEYEQFKKASEALDKLPQQGRDVFDIQIDAHVKIERPLPQVNLPDLLLALKEVLKRASLNTTHQIKFEKLSVRERMVAVLMRLNEQSFTEFTKLFNPTEGKLGVVVTFLAILELLKQMMIELIQNEPFSAIHIRKSLSGDKTTAANDMRYY